ncbi:UNVERIFIED_CONTAM: hypothetical protein Sradi_2505200 [Sesamum radiatum]|uniref:Uncharacterized protein n=1 Tax=Sesamum radiatum TaxID=300843 RepID=A0AAW2SL36_SESRA
MVLANYADFDVWVGGVIEWVPAVRYVGGIRVWVPKVVRERLYYGDIIDMYSQARGKGLNMVVYYCLTGVSLDNGIRLLNGDDGIIELLRAYKGLDVIPLYFEEKQGPLLTPENPHEPEQTDGNFPKNPPIEGLSDEGGDDSDSGSSDSSASQCPSWMLEDLEGPLDDHIFESRPDGHARKLFKTMRVFLREQKKKRRAEREQREQEERTIRESRWFSDGGEEDELVSLRESDDRDIGSQEQRGWAFISDRQKGLLEAVSSLAPNAEHRFCLRHMYNNFKGKFKGQELKKLFWKAASTYNVKQHLRWMKEIDRVMPKKFPEDETAYDWLCEIPVHHWARLNMEEYVDDYFKKDAYLRAYGHMINPVPGMHDYEESPLGIVEPPQVKSKPGRPKKVGRRDANDIRDGVNNSAGPSNIRNEQVDIETETQTEEISHFQMIMHFKYQTSLLKQEVIRKRCDHSIQKPIPRFPQSNNILQVEPENVQSVAPAESQSMSNLETPIESSQRPLPQVPKRRKQLLPVSRTSKSQKIYEDSSRSTTFRRECCSSDRSTLNSQLKNLSASYRPSQDKK